MTVEVIEGDILELAKLGEFDLIVHGCNCHNTWGSGLALDMKKQYPGAYEADCKTEKGSRDKLGRFTRFNADGLIIINAYTQFDFGREKDVCYLDYAALLSVFKRIHKAANTKAFRGKKIAMPKIGCGLAGGRWEIVHGIMKTVFKDMDVVVVELPKSDVRNS